MRHLYKFQFTNESVKFDISKYNEILNHNWFFEKGSPNYLDFIYTIIRKDLGKDTNGENLIIEVKFDFGIEYGGFILSINNKESLSKGLFGHLLGTSEPGGYVNGDGLNSHVEKYMIDFLGLKELKNQLNLIIQDYHGSKFKTSDLFKIIKKMK